MSSWAVISKCRVCGKEYLRSEGVRGCCSRECSIEDQRIYREVNLDKLKLKDKENYYKDIEKSREISRMKYHKHRDKRRETYRVRSKDKLKLKDKSYYIKARSLFKKVGFHHINNIAFDNRPENLYPVRDQVQHDSIHLFLSENHIDVVRRGDLFAGTFNSDVETKYKHLLPTAPRNTKERHKQNNAFREFCIDYLNKFKLEHPHDVDANPKNYLPDFGE